MPNTVRSAGAPWLRMLLALLLAMMGAACTPDATDDPCDRLRLVALNSFAITRGDYTLNSGASVAGSECDDGVLPVELGPRSALSDPARWLGEFRRDDSGHVLGPNPLPWRLTDILAAAAGQSSGERDDPLANLPPDGSTQIFVSLTRPLEETEVRDLWPNPLAVMVAPARPLLWEATIFCDYRGFDACAFDDRPDPLTAQFRHWVSLLRADDAPVLTQFDLTLAELREYASAGLIHGFITQDRAGGFRKLARDPRVREIRMIDSDLSSL